MLKIRHRINQNKYTFLNPLEILNKYRILSGRLNYEPFRRNPLKIRTPERLLLKDSCPAAGHPDATTRKADLQVCRVLIAFKLERSKK